MRFGFLMSQKLIALAALEHCILKITVTYQRPQQSL